MSKRQIEAWKEHRPRNEPYTSAKVMEILPLVYGRKGEFAIKLYSYLRWMDDMVDENMTMDRNEKLAFIDRQAEVVAGFPPDKLSEMEELFCRLPWEVVPDPEIRHCLVVLLYSIRDDVEHQGLIRRTEREIRHYNWRTLQPCLDLLALVLNGRMMNPDSRFMKLVDSWNMLGSLEQIGDDIEQRSLKLPMPITDGENPSAGDILAVYDTEKFNMEKWRCLKTMMKNSDSFLRLNMPLWQRLLCLAYMGEVFMKKGLLMNRDSSLQALKS